MSPGKRPLENNGLSSTASGMQTVADHPALLRTPGRGGFPSERILPGSPSDYRCEAGGCDWALVTDKLGGAVYFGPGPASVVRSPAPF